MSKQLLISIQPQHACNILAGNKTLEIRKRVPKDYVGWVYVYVTKKQLQLLHFNDSYYDMLSDKLRVLEKATIINGTIPCHFWFDEYETISVDEMWNCMEALTYTHKQINRIVDDSCLYLDELLAYAGENHKDLYAWHIKKLGIFDKPKALSEFKYFKTVKHNVDDVIYKASDYMPVTKAPQNYMYVEVEE